MPEKEISTWMTPVEVAELLRIPVATLYGWRYRGEGPPAARVGRHLRYRRAGVDAWMREREGHSR
jgi:excisionase family DNA binding protein